MCMFRRVAKEFTSTLLQKCFNNPLAHWLGLFPCCRLPIILRYVDLEIRWRELFGWFHRRLFLSLDTSTGNFWINLHFNIWFTLLASHSSSVEIVWIVRIGIILIVRYPFLPPILICRGEVIWVEARINRVTVLYCVILLLKQRLSKLICLLRLSFSW